MTARTRLARYRQRIERHNRSINAVLDTDWERAEEAAVASDERATEGNSLGPLDGLCVGVKANIAVEGLPHHAGIAAYRETIAREDAEVVARLRMAGAIIIGALNMHEGALGATTDNEAFGRCYNPWRDGFTPGGSSGGSGAAVSAGFCDLALGSDTMGSVRIPSAYCGNCGHKPTTGMVPTDGVLALSTTLDHVGPHARSVGLIRDALSVMAKRRLLPSGRQLSQIRLGIWHGSGAVELSPAVRRAFGGAADLVSGRASGAMTVTPPFYDYSRSRRAGLLISEVEGYSVHAARLAETGEGFTPGFRKLLEWGANAPQVDVDAAYEHIAAVREGAKTLFDRVDLVLAPVAPQEAFSFDAPVPINQADFTAWADFAALPAISLWTGLSGDGLPMSVQLIGPRGADALVLDIAAELEELFGPARPPPGFDW